MCSLPWSLGPSVFQFCCITNRRSYFFHCSATERSILPVCGSQSASGRPLAPRGLKTAFQADQSLPDIVQLLPLPRTFSYCTSRRTVRLTSPFTSRRLGRSQPCSFT